MTASPGADPALPGELKKALAARPAAKAAYEALAPARKAEIIAFITQVKTPSEKARRAGLACARLTGGA